MGTRISVSISSIVLDLPVECLPNTLSFIVLDTRFNWTFKSSSITSFAHLSNSLSVTSPPAIPRTPNSTPLSSSSASSLERSIPVRFL